MDEYNFKTWQQLSAMEEIKAIYAPDASDPDRLPFSVRDALGDFLAAAEFNHANPQQKSTFLSSLQEHLTTVGDEVALEEFANFCTLSQVVEGKKKKHNKSSLYEVIKTCFEKERTVEESEMEVDEDIPKQFDELSSSQLDQEISMSSSSSSSDARSPNVVDTSMQQDEFMETDNLNSSHIVSQFPSCTDNLFRILHEHSNI